MGGWRFAMFKRRWFRRQPRKGSIGYLGYILALVGGAVMIVLSLAAMLSFGVHMPFRSPIAGYFEKGVITLILGVVVVVGSKRANELIWAIVLIAVGYLGGGIGGLLTLIGGLLRLLSRYV
jgi:hypothetical protein